MDVAELLEAETEESLVDDQTRRGVSQWEHQRIVCGSWRKCVCAHEFVQEPCFGQGH